MAITESVRNELLDPVTRKLLHAPMRCFPPTPTSIKRVKKGVMHGATWSPEEHRRFLHGLETYPNGPWKAVANVVGTKTPRQTISHAQKYRQMLARRQKAVAKNTPTSATEKSSQLPKGFYGTIIEDTRQASPVHSTQSQPSCQLSPSPVYTLPNATISPISIDHSDLSLSLIDQSNNCLSFDFFIKEEDQLEPLDMHHVYEPLHFSGLPMGCATLEDLEVFLNPTTPTFNL